jgi:hypothetical protein
VTIVALALMVGASWTLRFTTTPRRCAGGEHFFREARTEHTVIFEILP